MDKLVKFIETKLAPPLLRISQNRYLDAIQKSFMIVTPYLLISSLFLLVASLPIPGWTNIVKPYAPMLNSVVNATLGIIAVIVSVSLGYSLGEFYKKKDKRVSPLSTAILGLVSFLMLFPVTAMKDGSVVIDASHFNSAGLFSAIIVVIISTEIYRFAVNKNLVIRMPEQVPPMVSQSFAAIIPAFLTILFWFIVLKVAQVNLTNIVDQGFAPLLLAGSTPLAQFIGFMLDRLLWFVGIHGSNVVGSVMSPIWTQMITDNINAFSAGKAIPWLYTNVWIEYVVRVSLVPLVILMIFSKVKSYKMLGKMSLAPAIFNIAEPIMFGLPLVLNPILFIPWVFGYAIIFLFSYVCTAFLHLIPPMVATVPWTIPGPIAAYLGTNGSWVAAAISLLNMVIMFFIWLPFFKVLERQELSKEGVDNQ